MNKRGAAAKVVLAAISVSVLPVMAIAAETITYSYDAKGRLVKVERSGTANNNVKAEYSHDKADNRTNVTVTGSPNATPP